LKTNWNITGDRMDYVSQLVKNGISTKIIGNQIHYYETVGSTMDEVHGLAKAGCLEGLIVIAENQIAGRGRTGRNWMSEPGNLLFSVLLKPSVDYISVLQPMIAICVAKGISSATNVKVDLKWPNDLMIESNKIGGILLESSVRDNILEYVVAGIGLNLKLSEKPTNENYDISDLNTFSDNAVNRSELLKEILENLDSYYSRINDPSPIFEEWKNLLGIVGSHIRFNSGEEKHEGEVIYIDENGSLGLKEASGQVKEFMTGDILEVYE